MNFGGSPFSYPQPGYKPIQNPPPLSLLKQTGLLINCVCQIVQFAQEAKKSSEKQQDCKASENLQCFSVRLATEVVRRFVDYVVSSKHREYLFAAEVVPAFFEHCVDTVAQVVHLMQLVCDQSTFESIIDEIFRICVRGARSVSSNIRRASSGRRLFYFFFSSPLLSFLLQKRRGAVQLSISFLPFFLADRWHSTR